MLFVGKGKNHKHSFHVVTVSCVTSVPTSLNMKNVFRQPDRQQVSQPVLCAEKKRP